MIQGRLCRVDNDSCLIPTVYKTSSLYERLRGLLGRAPLKIDEALLIKLIFPRFHGHIVKHSFSIHTASGSDYQ